MASPFSIGGLSSPGFGAITATPMLKPGVRPGYSLAGLIGSNEFERQIEGEILPRLQDITDANARARNEAALRAHLESIRTKPVYPDLTPQAGLVPNVSGMTAGGPVRALSVTKDPELERDLLKVLADTRNTDFTTLTRQPRSSRLGDELGNAFARFRGDASDASQSIKDYVEEFLSVRPEAKALVDREVGAVNRILGPASESGSLASDLAGNLSRNMLNRGEVTNRLLSQLTRTSKLRDLLSPGGASSYLNREAGRATGDVLLQDAIARAEMERRNLVDTAGLQTGVIGRGDDVIAQYLNQGLIPFQAQQALASSNIGNLANLGGVELANTLLTRPADDLAQRLALLNAASAARRGIRYEGLEGQFNNVQPRALNYNPLDPTAGVDLSALLELLNEGSGGRVAPTLGTTSGAPSISALNPGNEQALDYFDAELNSGLPLSWGPGSAASALRLPGTTMTNAQGRNFVMSPRTRSYLPVGPDGLTDEQRYYDTTNPLF